MACAGSGNSECKGHSERLVEQHTILNLGTFTKHTKRIDSWVAALVLDLMRDMLLKQQSSYFLWRTVERSSEHLQRPNGAALGM